MGLRSFPGENCDEMILVAGALLADGAGRNPCCRRAAARAKGVAFLGIGMAGGARTGSAGSTSTTSELARTIGVIALEPDPVRGRPLTDRLRRAASGHVAGALARDRGHDSHRGTNDSGAGSLRQAILDSNADSGDVDRISFNILGAGLHTIAPSTALPAMTQPAIIDGTTQPGFAGTPIIELSGANIATTVAGLAVNSPSGGAIKGLVVNRFRGAGITVSGPGITISGNYVGNDDERDSCSRQFRMGSRCSIPRTTSSAVPRPALAT